MLVDAPERRLVERVGTRDAGGVQRRRGVVNRDDRGSQSVCLARDAERAPERVVQDHHIRPHRAQRLPYCSDAEREAVPVRGGELQRGQFVATAGVKHALTRYDEVMLERAGRPRESCLLVQICAYSTAPLRVEESDVAHHEPVPVGVARGGSTVHAGHCVSRPGAIVLLTGEGQSTPEHP
jgi:hypothetical protein